MTAPGDYCVTADTASPWKPSYVPSRREQQRQALERERDAVASRRPLLSNLGSVYAPSCSTSRTTGVVSWPTIP